MFMDCNKVIHIISTNIRNAYAIIASKNNRFYTKRKTDMTFPWTDTRDFIGDSFADLQPTNLAGVGFANSLALCFISSAKSSIGDVCITFVLLVITIALSGSCLKI